MKPRSLLGIPLRTLQKYLTYRLSSLTGTVSPRRRSFRGMSGASDLRQCAAPATTARKRGRRPSSAAARRADWAFSGRRTRSGSSTS